VKIIGENPVNAQAGIATIILQAGTAGGNATLCAKANGLKAAELGITLEA